MHEKKTHNIFYGNFDSFKIACSEQNLRNSEVAEKAFSSTRWKNRQRAFLNMSQDGRSPRSSILPSFLADHKEIDSILDIGGGSGWIFNLLQIATDRNFTYWNFELSEMCEEFSKEFDNSNKVHFIDSWNLFSNLNEISLIYSNSTMQYIPDDIFFENLSKVNQPRYIVFDDFIVTNSISYWTLQNYYGDFIPYCFRNLEEFNLKLLKIGYSVILLEEYRQTLTPGFIYGNEKMPQTIVYKLGI